MKYSVILLAAGTGSRMHLGYNKMLLRLNEQPLFILSLKKFIQDEQCEQIILVINQNDEMDIRQLLNDYKMNVKKCEIAFGGPERQMSVYNGLKLVNCDMVLVHDGARPFIDQTLIDRLLNEANNHGCAIPAVKVKDTIKWVEHSFVKETLPRQALYAVQTPQASNTLLLREAHEKATSENYLGTDEASLIEKYTNHSVKIVESSYDNIKITTAEDLIYAQNIYDKYY